MLWPMGTSTHDWFDKSLQGGHMYDINLYTIKIFINF
jgi:hypothetical protein